LPLFPSYYKPPKVVALDSYVYGDGNSGNKIILDDYVRGSGDNDDRYDFGKIDKVSKDNDDKIDDDDDGDIDDKVDDNKDNVEVVRGSTLDSEWSCGGCGGGCGEESESNESSLSSDGEEERKREKEDEKERDDCDDDVKIKKKKRGRKKRESKKNLFIKQNHPILSRGELLKQFFLGNSEENENELDQVISRVTKWDRDLVDSIVSLK
jgi:hypothetical protein